MASVTPLGNVMHDACNSIPPGSRSEGRKSKAMLHIHRDAFNLYGYATYVDSSRLLFAVREAALTHNDSF